MPLAHDHGTQHSCYPIWDSANARLSPCAIPYVSAIPAVIVLIIAINYLHGHVFPRWGPQWTKPFVSEHPPECSELPPEPAKQPKSGWAISLFVLSVVGCAAEIVQLLPPGLDFTAVTLLVSWVGIFPTYPATITDKKQGVAALVIAVKRPRSCPTAMLAYFIAAFAVELTLVVNRPSAGFKLTAHYVAIGAAAAACLTLLLMPLREPSLPSFNISAVGQRPSSDFRSPEDNLRLWQFLTVSWMAPLMNIGQKRTLQETDVWFLAFEFQHKRLHEKFRQLKGSVLGHFSTPILLQQLLQAMKDPSSPKRVALTYALLTLVLRLVAAQSQVFNLWYGRRCYERSRGEMIMMVYEKALSRKNVFGSEINGKPESSEDQDDELVNGNANGVSRRKDQKEKAKESASMGKIFNLLRGDVYEVAQRLWEIDALVDKPVGLIIATVLVWKLFGPSCFLGILSLLVAQSVNALISRALLRWERVRRAATDARLQITSQFVEAIRHLRWYGWHNHWLRQVMDARQRELNLRIITSLWNILIRFINAFSSGVFPVVALYAYTLLAGHPLSIDIIFPALQLFTMLETRLRDIPGLITALINASIALGRIEDFMAEPDKESNEAVESSTDSTIRLESCSFAWPGRMSPVLADLNLTIPKGLTVVYGKVGAGKTALLQALLGELDKLSGDAHIPNEMVGYCAQTPWLQSMSIRDNILFSAPYDEQRYKRVLDACALLPDLANFKHGDLSFVGENGIGLSGGQKARVALARAVYSTARILLLDDPLSALDYNTAEAIVRKCLSGPLMRDRTVVLVTHRTTLVRHIADQFIEIADGRATVYDKEAISSAAPADGVGQAPQLRAEPENQAALEEEASAAVPDKFIEEEHRAEWGVKARVYWSYIRAGKLKCLSSDGRWTVVVSQGVGRGLQSDPRGVQLPWFQQEDFRGVQHGRPFQGPQSYRRIAATAGRCSTLAAGVLPHHDVPVRHPAGGPAPDAGHHLLRREIPVPAGDGARQPCHLPLLRRDSSRPVDEPSDVGYRRRRRQHQRAVPDHRLPGHYVGFVHSRHRLGDADLPRFSFALTAAFVMIFLRFLPTSQSLRRLEMVSLSPLMSNFGELLHGLTTVRAFRAQVRFQNRVIQTVDKFQGMDHFYWSLQAWLIYRFESLSAISTFCLTALALYTNVSPGLVAFVLIAANSFVESTHALCKQYGQLQMDFVSVERVDELRHIEQEPAGTIDPLASWPRFGSAITFENVTIRYAPHLDPSLKNISLRIPGGSTTAVIGRTGSGKSTLALSLLGVVRPESGRIMVDDMDISAVSTQSLRTRVTFVAQDPILFPGSIRLNLDPTGEYTDSECAEVLQRICSKRHGWTLSTQIEAGGRNLSQGQRQLIGLTRAVLRRSPIVILDEATASIDHETSLEIQKVIREELRESTVVTIAHRLEAVKDADYYVVLDRGMVEREGRVV
ncbi:Multidrug resistance-associated protein/mitoxantrone resistance protein [Rasamsonia emersonii CBS 393.64]|uniref:Multidrug resistance-associated protein/mitoxantrone resistance protein n=1 Tax=Rasamsonia emersonii (strain ATCC 16479 / CBS 393.64 / IMI 116815) TaxID=1408163 RepID=A0A0F4Z1S0_RASE3|nr:Multidrug resistance-associated protein/mitoxantrone resistance protein [Rasamsonia emersonii CBS 393.64]KKA23808.1 Multidrug resistance-associated protein/mitoxantrone resistance protein [Rasamsonia emersonii CBS 393.64]